MAVKRTSSRERVLEAALTKLVNKIREIENSKEYKHVWALWASRGQKYTGPSYYTELLDAEEILND